MVCFIAGEKRATPDLIEEYMACARIKAKSCARCGSVPKTHFAKRWAPNSQKQDRLQSQHAFFSKKKKLPTETQLTLQRRLM